MIAIQYACILGLLIEIWIVIRKWKNVLHGYLLLSFIASFAGNTGYLLQMKAQTEEGYITALKYAYLGRTWYSFFLFLFIAELTGFKLNDILKKVLFIFQAAVYASVLTLESNDLYYTWTRFDTSGIFPALKHGNGILHHTFFALQALYILTGLALLFLGYRREKNSRARDRFIMVILAVLAEGLFFIIFNIGIPGPYGAYDITSFGYFIGTLIMLIAITSFDLLGTTEIAKEFVIDRISEGIIAVDNEGTVQYFNEPAARLYPVLTDKRRAAELSGMDPVLNEIMTASLEGGTITLDERIYKPEENSLLYKGESFGKLYALVDETEHYRYMEELQRQREIADSANAAKSRFLANMSHEIRTPITAVLGMDEMILRESGEENIRSYAADIMSAGRTLLSLINDILDLSKVEEGKVELLPVQYEPGSLINDLVNLIRDRAVRKGLKLNVEVNSHIPRLLFGDEVRIRQCVLNILTNAVKYTEKGSVTLKVDFERPEGTTGEKKYILLSFTVSDTGIGMKAEDMNKLFSPYSRLDEERNRNIEGTGLGMSITTQLLELMGSSLYVESEYGKGSIFSFSVRQEAMSEEEIGEWAFISGDSMASDTYSQLFVAPDARILLVDDTEMNLAVIKALLKQTEIRIDTAGSGKDAVALASANKYDVMLIDHMMPVMDGIETLRHVRASGRNTETPAIVLTANAVSGAREMYLEAGFSDYLSKPVDSARLEKMLAGLIPAEKLMVPGIQIDGEQKEEDVSSDEPKRSSDIAASSPLPSGLYEIDGIDVKEGIGNCGSEDGFLSVLTVFHRTAASKADEIERLYREGALEDYTIKVHALKSSARIIGASGLSELALKLEEAGKKKDTAFIDENTDTLLEMYRLLDTKLAVLDDAEGELPEISSSALSEAYQTIAEIARAMDYGLMDDLLKELKGYRLKPQDKERITEIENRLSLLDWDGIVSAAEGAQA